MHSRRDGQGWSRPDSWPGLEQARAAATANGDRRVGTQHLLLALLMRPDGTAGQALAQAGVGLTPVQTVLAALHGPHPPLHHRVRLRSGDDVLVRTLRPGDADGLGRMFDELSETSRYQRFLGGKPAVSPRALQRLVDIDHRDHEVLVAVREEGDRDGDGEVVGEARFVRDDDEPTVAEMAITVADAWQRRGLGTALAHDLAHRAADEGVEEFSAEVLTDNAGIRRLVDQVGEVASAPQGSGVSVLRVATTGHDDDPLVDEDGIVRRMLHSAASEDFLVIPTPLRWGPRISGAITKTLLVPVRVLLRRR